MDPSKQSLWLPLRKVTWSDDSFAKTTLIGGGHLGAVTAVGKTNGAKMRERWNLRPQCAPVGQDGSRGNLRA